MAAGTTVMAGIAPSPTQTFAQTQLLTASGQIDDANCYGTGNISVALSTTLGNTNEHTHVQTVAYEARQLKALFLTLSASV